MRARISGREFPYSVVPHLFIRKLCESAAKIRECAKARL
jgi:hypothetical protein